MAEVGFSDPVTDSVAKVDNEVAVGEDLQFQEKWWRFERAAWIFFVLVILLDLAGLFGRGPLSKATKASADGTIDVHYERIARSGTPNIMWIAFGPQAIADGKVRLFVSNSIVEGLGNQRVVPSPESTVIGQGGLTYTFPASIQPATIEFALQPSGPGIYPFKIQVVGAAPVQEKIVVVP